MCLSFQGIRLRGGSRPALRRRRRRLDWQELSTQDDEYDEKNSFVSSYDSEWVPEDSEVSSSFGVADGRYLRSGSVKSKTKSSIPQPAIF